MIPRQTNSGPQIAHLRDMPTAYQVRLRELLDKHLPNVTVWAHSSWILREMKPHPHVDLIAFDQPDANRPLSVLRHALSTAQFPVMLSVHAWNDLPETFRHMVRHDHVVLTRCATTSRKPIVFQGEYLEPISIIIERLEQKT